MPTFDPEDSSSAGARSIQQRIDQLKLAALTPDAGSRADASRDYSQLNGSGAADMSSPDCLAEGGDADPVRYSVDLQYQPQQQPQQPSPTHHQQQQPNGQQSQLISRTQRQSTTQQVTTVTKVFREVHHIGPDGQVIEPGQGDYYGPGPEYSPYAMDPYRPASPGSEQGSRRNYDPYAGHSYRDYEPYPPPPEYAYGPPGSDYGGYGGEPSRGGGGGYPDRPPTPPSPSDRSESPPPDKSGQPGYPPAGHYPQSGYDELDSTLMAGRGQDPYGPSMLPPGHEPSPGGDAEPGRPLSRQSRQSGRSAAPRAVFDEVIRDVVREGEQHARPASALSQQTVRFRDPDLHEVINFLSNPNNVVKANASAYLQHLCYMDDPMKQKTRALGGIPPLVVLLSHDIPEVHRNACGALRNLSYGRQNDENKRAIKNAGGVPALIRLLRKTPENEIKELVTGILWNLSSCEDLKRAIIDDGLTVLVNYVIIPHSGWNRGNAHSEPVMDVFWSTVFRNATGVLRNVSSAGEYARKKLRECEGLVDALLMVIKSAIGKSNIDNKCVENCVCILRNLSYRCQEVEDPHYDKQAMPPPGKPTASAASRDQGENAGCFGGKKRRDGPSGGVDTMPGGGGPPSAGAGAAAHRHAPVKGMELLWQPDIVQPYLSLLSDCSNPETLEAAAGAIQNLSACYWQPSVDIRAAVRKEKGLPILVELLRMEADRVVCAVATALRNLAIDQRNKELIGKYAMRDLVQKLPSGSQQQDQATSDDTIAAVLATLNEVIKKSAEFSRSLFELDGVKRLLIITRHRHRYSSRVIKFAGQVLFSMWLHQDLREVYKKANYKEADFVTKSVAARNTNPNSPSNTNSTLNRPMASQGGTKYEDRTMPRGASAAGGNGTYGRRPPTADGEQIALGDLPGYEPRPPPPGGVRMYPQPPGRQPGEPVYAQVNRDKKRQQAGAGDDYEQPGPGDVWGYRDEAAPAGDSWV